MTIVYCAQLNTNSSIDFQSGLKRILWLI